MRHIPEEPCVEREVQDGEACADCYDLQSGAKAKEGISSAGPSAGGGRGA